MASIAEILSMVPDQPAAEPGEKVASVQPSNVATARQELDAALADLQSGQTKVASTQESAVDTLEKIASDLADADEIGRIKEAQAYGAALFDGWIQRANQYGQGGMKVAAAAGHVEPLQGGVADNQQIKLASELGYQATENALNRMLGETVTSEKTAADEEMRGVVHGLEKLAEYADDCYVRGYTHMRDLIEAQG